MTQTEKELLVKEKLQEKIIVIIMRFVMIKDIFINLIEEAK
jgi:hypothetical protein